MKKIILFILATIICQQLDAQKFVYSHDPMVDTMFNRRVKSLDEFFARFNGLETNPDIPKESAESRENNILSLFNQEMLILGQAPDEETTKLYSDITEFIQTVCKNNIQLRITDSMFLAEAELVVKFQGKDKRINMILNMEDKGNNIFCWTFCGVNGLVGNKMLDTTVAYGIRPVDNEVNFIQMRGIVTNPENRITNYRNSRTVIDPLSYLFALANTKQIQVLQCNKVLYHSFCIDGYYFIIEFFNRKDFNSGWLISDFKQIDQKEKEIQLNKLFDK